MNSSHAANIVLTNLMYKMASVIAAALAKKTHGRKSASGDVYGDFFA